MKIKKLTNSVQSVTAESVIDAPEVKENPYKSARKNIMKAISQLQKIANDCPDCADKCKDSIANLSVIYFDLAE